MKSPNREDVEVLGATFEAGKPQGEVMGKWNNKFSSRAESLKYLQTGQRYFYPSGEGFGSEKRKKPA
jgi:hypothetical protein